MTPSRPFAIAAFFLPVAAVVAPSGSILSDGSPNIPPAKSCLWWGFNGPDRFNGNSMYLALVLVPIAVPSPLPEPLPLALSAFSVLTLHLTALRPEEKYLAAKFGTTYTTYLDRTRRQLR